MSNYAKITNNEIEKLGPRPKWLDDNGDPVSDAILKEHGWLPVIDEPPEYDATTQWLNRHPFEEWTVETDVVRATYTVHDRDPAEIAEMLARAIDAERDRRISAGFEFQGKWYQTRPDDRENIAGATQSAFMAVMNGVGEPGNLYWQDEAQPFGWIAEDNTITPMDAPTMIEFGKAALAHKAKLIFIAHEIKNASPIPEDFTDDKWWS